MIWGKYFFELTNRIYCITPSFCWVWYLPCQCHMCPSTSGPSTHKNYADLPAFYLSLVTPLNGLVPLSRPYVSSSTSRKMPVADN